MVGASINQDCAVKNRKSTEERMIRTSTQSSSPSSALNVIQKQNGSSSFPEDTTTIRRNKSSSSLQQQSISPTSLSIINDDGLPSSGLHVLNANSAAVPLGKARSLLRDAIRDLPALMMISPPPSPSSTPSSTSSPRFLRFEVKVTDVEDEEDALIWLRAQPERLMPGIFFRVPERSLIMAGLGAAHLISGPGELNSTTYKQEMGLDAPSTPPGTTYYGGGRFDPSYPKPSADWEGFGTTYMVLPALELIHHSAAAENDDGDRGLFRLVVNIRFTGMMDLLHARSSLLDLLRDVCVDIEDDQEGDVPLPAPASCEEPSQFDAWHESIGRALAAMKAGEYRKVVLARAAQLTFPRKPRPLDLVLRLRDHYGYLFCIQLDADRAFLGCTPEQLFKVSGPVVTTEALAGTRPRGNTADEDERLAAELMASQKDRFENDVTAESIEAALRPLVHEGKVERFPGFVLRLRHVQHICHKISARLLPSSTSAQSLGPAFDLLAALHPTPAVAGQPRVTSLQAIRVLEPFDRGLYAGPVGYVSPSCCEFAVAIRSVLIIREKAHVFAGAGIVPGSTAEGEWAEIGAKMANFVRMFPPAAPPLRSLPNLSTLWATLVIEELARNGVTHFCVAPGSRSTPLVTAAARHPHTTLMVHHDERGAGFYCVGYARARGRPSAIIVTSGTAVANLLPAAVEAATDRVPLLLLTADRPPEARDCGANQTIAQPNIFAGFARWTKDVPCPTHEVLASSLLSDIDYAVSMARGVDPGPVHLNFMLRENLAPEGGVVRDSSVPGLSSEWPDACLSDRRFAQWERDLRPYTTFPRLRSACTLPADVVEAVHGARRGVLVFGRLPQRRDRAHARWLAQGLRWPVLADVGSGLRRDLALQALLVGPYEAILADPITSSALDPDVILQLGSPLVSKRLPKFLAKSRANAIIHVIPSPARRDPELTATHHICSDLSAFVRALDSSLDWSTMTPSGLLPLLTALAARLEQNIAEELGPDPMDRILTEPMVAHLVARLLPPDVGLFLSNSMPVRDMDAFASRSPYQDDLGPLHAVAMNRGASGIDGIVSTAMGYATGLGRPVTLLIGDMACLHDLSALHALSAPGSPAPPVTVVLVNNGGGGIFSFLPIARHADVFSPFFDSSHDLDFGPITQAFNLPYSLCRSSSDLVSALSQAHASARPSIIEVVTDRAHNVRVHRQLGSGLRSSIHAALLKLIRLDWIRAGQRNKPPLLLLHGFLGCKEDWAPLLWAGPGRGLALDYDCLAVDLPGHGTTAVEGPGAASSVAYSMPVVALALIELLDRLKIGRCAVMGYSLGGRVAAYLAHQYPDRISGLIMVSSHPGLRSEGERLERSMDDQRLCKRIETALQAEGGWEAFLRWWYSKPLWGRLAERTPAYARMMLRRRSSLERTEDPGGVARALLGMSVAQQPSLWDFVRSGSMPTLIVYGAADSKYAALGEELRGGLMADGAASAARTLVEVRCIDDAGHAVLAEKEAELLRETTAFLRRHLEDQQTSSSSSSTSASASNTQGRVASLSWTPLILRLKKTLNLSAGQVHERKGLLVYLQSDTGAVGVGEVSPLPGFSRESLSEAERQLKELAESLPGRSLPKASNLERWTDWLAVSDSKSSSSSSSSQHASSGRRGQRGGAKGRHQQAQKQQQQHHQQQPLQNGNGYHHASSSGQALLPSVRTGIEMALTHLLAQECRVSLSAVVMAGRSTLLHTGRVHLNGLMLRPSLSSTGEHIRSSSRSNTSRGGGGSKVKVGGRPVEEDLASVNEMLAGMQGGSHERLRLDANQAWTLEEAIVFVRGLTQPQLIEYIEEPLQDPLSIPDLYQQSGRVVPFALDETLVQSPRPLADLVNMEGISALVIKPTILGGLSACLNLHSMGSAKDLTTVISSSFESSIGLSHLAILASVLNPSRVLKGGQPIMHGLSTYDMFSSNERGGGEEEAALASILPSSPSSSSAPSSSSTALSGGKKSSFSSSPSDTAQPSSGFAACVHGDNLLVDVLGCQELLDAYIRLTRHRTGEEEGKPSAAEDDLQEKEVTKGQLVIQERVGTPERTGVEREQIVNSTNNRNSMQ